MRLTLFIMLFLCFSTDLFAENQDSVNESQLVSVKEQITALKKLLSSQVLDESKAELELKSIEKSLSTIRLKLNQHDKDIKLKSAELGKLQRQSGKLSLGLDSHKQQLSAQLLSAYQMGQQAYLQLLLSQNDLSSVDRISTYYEYLNKARITQITAVKNQLSEVQALRTKISQQTKSLKSTRKQKDADLQLLTLKFDERNSVLESLRSQISGNKNNLSSLEKDKKRLSKLINSLKNISTDTANAKETIIFSRDQGLLPWPHTGKVIHSFGSLRAGQDINWQGLFLASEIGKPIYSIAQGRVVFSDWLAGFGLLTIIDHQNNFMSLYAHNSVLFHEIGDWVNTKELIAESGQTGGIYQPGLYFEIRKAGEAVNPKFWLSKR